MAFGKKYFSSYKSNNNLDYYLEIFLEDYTGSALELVMGAGGPVIEYETDQEDRFSPIISSSCKIPYLVENYLDSLFIDDLRNNYQERQVYVHIYRSTQSGSSAVAPLWSGFLVMDIGSGVDKYFPYEEHLKFVDGLSLLKDIDFVDLGVTGGSPPFEERVQGNYAQENMYFGPATYIYWIREILAKSGAALTNQGASQNYGFTTSVNWYNGEMNTTGQSSDPLDKTKCAVSMFHRKDDQGVFYPDNCYNVLKELLRHWGARITYWKHEFWIVQIPEYITSESGTISTPVNNNSRLYSNTGAYQGSQNHLGDTYYTRYEQTIENDKISKLTGTKYDYLPIIKQVNADFLSFSSKSYFGGFPFGSTAPTQEVFQGTINSPSAADFLYLSIPLDWTWDMSQAGNVNNNLSGGHTMGWWCAVKFNFYASDGTTTYYLQYNFSDGSYYWVDSALWTPLGTKSPRYTISSKLAVVSGHIGFEQKIPFQDENGSAISMSGAWSFFLDIEDYGTSSSNPGSFYCNFSGYNNPTKMRNPQTNITIVSPLGVPLKSGTVSWSNTLQDAQGQVTISTINNPAGFNAGTVNPDIRFATTSPFLGLLQTLNNTQSASFGETFNVINSNTQAKQNSEQFDFGTLLWGDSLEFAPSSLQVFDGSTYVNTEPSGEWGRGILTGTKTFTAMLIDEFFSGQTKIIISPSMRLAVGVANKNEDQGGTLRPRYVNPIGKLRETRDGTDPEYFFRRGSFYTLLDEWDYEGYQIIRNVPTTTTQSNGMGSMGGSQSGSPAPSGMSPNLMVQALSQNSPLAYIRTTIPATGSNVAVNGNFNTAVGWTLGTGWSIDTTAKKAKFAATGSTSELTQSVLTQGLTYQVNFQVEVTAGTLLVKAGTSGTSQSITSSGDYSIYLDCEGSSLIKFQAGTTFTGNITYITLRDQKSLSSVPIEAIGTAVFKTGDTFNLINSNDDTILPLTVTSNQGSTDTTISVSSTPLYEDIDNGSYLLINQDDLSAQYQNKTKGTVGGFDITATSIDSGSVAISSYIDDDTFATASATSLATSESIKAYVDGQAGHSETLQGVTDNGNSTSNSIKITGGATEGGNSVQLVYNANYAQLQLKGSTGSFVNFSDGSTDFKGRIQYINSDNSMKFVTNTSEKMRLTSTGLGIGTTSIANKLDVNGNISATNIRIGSNASGEGIIRYNPGTGNGIGLTTGALNSSSIGLFVSHSSNNRNIGINTNSPTEKLHVVGDILATGDSHADAFKPAVSGNPIKFKNFDSTTEFARITDGGNVLIGGTVLTNAQGWGKNLQIINSGSNGASLSVKDSNNEYNLATYGGNFLISDGIDERLIISGIAANAGQLQLPAYGSGSFTGTETYFLAVTSAGDVVEADSSALPGGPYLPLTAGSTVPLSGNLYVDRIRDTNAEIIVSRTSSTNKIRLGSGDSNDVVDIYSGGQISLTLDTSQNTTLTGALTGTTATFNSGTTNTVATFISTDSGAGIKLTDNSGSSTIQTTDAQLRIGVDEDGAVANSTIGFRVDGSTRMTLTDTGLGIGTTSPNTKLRIDLTDSTTYSTTSLAQNILRLNNNSNTNNSYAAISFAVNNNSGSTGNASILAFSTSTNSSAGLAFQTRDSGSYGERMRITSGGNVGIGESNPTLGKLQVNGNIFINRNGTNGLGANPYFENLLVSGIGTTNVSAIQLGNSFGQDTGTYLRFQVNSNSASSTPVNSLILNPNGTATFSGQVTIPATPVASTDAASKSYVDAQVSATDSLQEVTTIGNTTTNSIMIGSSSSPATILEVAGRIRASSTDSTFEAYESSTKRGGLQWDNTNDYLNLFSVGGDIRFDLGGEKMRLTSDGKLGIGTSSPSSFNAGANKLVVGNGTNFQGLTVNSIVEGNIYFADGTTSSQTYEGVIGYNHSNNFMHFYTNHTERARITSGGNLLLGTTADNGYKTEIAGNLALSLGADRYLRIGSSTNYWWDFKSVSNDLQLLEAGTTSRLIVKAGGNLLLGTTVDNGEKLQVEGDITASGDIHSDKVVFSGTNNRIDASTSGTVKIITSGVETATFTGTSSYLRNPNIVNTILLSGTKIVDTDRSLLNINNITTAGNVSIGGTVGAVYKLDVVGKQRVQSVLELEDVLTLNAISTPSDPASGKSSIYMDSADGAIKCKINVGGTVVTRTIASFE
jgi:hypothetical protein